MARHDHLGCPGLFSRAMGAAGVGPVSKRIKQKLGAALRHLRAEPGRHLRVHSDERHRVAGRTGLSGILTYGEAAERLGHEVSVFVWALAPPPRMIVFGTIDFAGALATAAKFLGSQVTVCEARPVFATRSRFPGVDEVVVDWPHRYLIRVAEAGEVDGRTVVWVLTHDAKFDVPVLKVALGLPHVGYVGAMGSRTTHEDRLARLIEAGVAENELARLRSPIGLDLGARTGAANWSDSPSVGSRLTLLRSEMESAPQHTLRRTHVCDSRQIPGHRPGELGYALNTGEPGLGPLIVHPHKPFLLGCGSCSRALREPIWACLRRATTPWLARCPRS